jgi:hypothetical protein
MREELYFAEDGTIHEKKSVKTSPGITMEELMRKYESNSFYESFEKGLRNSEVSSRNTAEEYKEYAIRCIVFWVYSTIASFFIGSGMSKFIFLMVKEHKKSFVYDIMPYAMIIGAVIGSVLYGIFLAEKTKYTIYSFILTSLAAALGSLVMILVIALLCIAMKLLIVAFVFIGIIGLGLGMIGE